MKRTMGLQKELTRFGGVIRARPSKATWKIYAEVDIEIKNDEATCRLSL